MTVSAIIADFAPGGKGGQVLWHIEIFIIAMFDFFCYTVICLMPPVGRIFPGGLHRIIQTRRNRADGGLRIKDG